MSKVIHTIDIGQGVRVDISHSWLGFLSWVHTPVGSWFFEVPTPRGIVPDGAEAKQAAIEVLLHAIDIGHPAAAYLAPARATLEDETVELDEPAYYEWSKRTAPWYA